MSARTFNDAPAVRTAVPILVGLVGPSGSGKTYSALRIATGIQRITGGEIFFIDTEARRALHYAEQFKFRHVQFDAPFGSLDYMAAIEHCVAKGAKVIVIDSLSHEHEGPGGVLEAHEVETTRLAEQWRTNRDKVQMTAWAKPKAERRRLISTILQLGINVVLCFRAKEKLKVIPGKAPMPLGWMPIAGEEFVFEMTVNMLLLPGSGGVPTWQPEEPGERAMIKLPEQFKAIFAERRPLDEKTGEALAKWAAGSVSGATVAHLSPQPTDTPARDLQTLCDIADGKIAEGLDALVAWAEALPLAEKKLIGGKRFEEWKARAA